MHKFKCEKCDHSAESEGDCPKDGSKLIESKASDGDKLKDILAAVGSTVESQVKSTLKEMGFGEGAVKSPIHPAAKMPGTKAEKLEYVKSILSDNDKAYLAN